MVWSALGAMHFMRSEKDWLTLKTTQMSIQKYYKTSKEQRVSTQKMDCIYWRTKQEKKEKKPIMECENLSIKK